MSVIAILPRHVADKIAAGEVVERPASVVKELVENSIDAGARRIEVFVKDGGRGEVVVVDDGCGMTRDDAVLSLERHATSKIGSEEDLSCITTLGFRGEALPSIASVSRLVIESRSSSEETGVQVVASGGVIETVTECACPVGTKVSVSDLFYNVPARRKFLKGSSVEWGHCYETVLRLALLKCGVQFFLSDFNKVRLRATGGNIDLRIAQLLGKKVYDNMCSLDIKDGEFHLYGFLSKPSYSKGSASDMYIYVNGRYVRNRMIIHAVMEGYKNLLMRGKYPVVVINVEVEPSLVDVTVSPTKTEVAFVKGGKLHDFIVHAVRGILENVSWFSMPSLTLDKCYTKKLPHIASSGADKPFVGLSENQVCERRKKEGESLRMDFVETGYFSSLRVLGQLGNSYIVCQSEEGDLVLIDQHAAHERIGFEILKKQYEEGRVDVQRLLTPEIVDLSPRLAPFIEEYMGVLESVGLELEHFGQSVYAVRSYPALLGGVDLKSLVTFIAEDLESCGSSSSMVDVIDVVLKSIACHGQVRAGQKLESEEISRLLIDMDRFSNTEFCPHGRPSYVVISKKDIAKFFRKSG